MNTQNLGVLAINSLPSNGNAGLKMVISVLGTLVIPVPSVILSGIGSMRHLTGFTRLELAFEDLLEGSLQIARQRKQALILYVGYLGHHEQILTILGLLDQYRDQIKYIFVDPVCGDNGKPYVSEEIIQHWPLLLAKADLAIPNLTEVALLAGHRQGIVKEQSDVYVEEFRQKFPNLDFVATSMSQSDELINRLYQTGKETNFHHFLHPGNYSGSGDAFASLFLYFHFFKGYSLNQSLQKAGDVMADLIRESLTLQSEDLIIQHGFNMKNEDYFDS